MSVMLSVLWLCIIRLRLKSMLPAGAAGAQPGAELPVETQTA